MSDLKDEIGALLARIRSPNTRKAGDAFFSADLLDLSITYLPDNFEPSDAQSGSTRSETASK